MSERKSGNWRMMAQSSPRAPPNWHANQKSASHSSSLVSPSYLAMLVGGQNGFGSGVLRIARLKTRGPGGSGAIRSSSLSYRLPRWVLYLRSSASLCRWRRCSLMSYRASCYPRLSTRRFWTGAVFLSRGGGPWLTDTSLLMQAGLVHFSVATPRRREAELSACWAAAMWSGDCTSSRMCCA